MSEIKKISEVLDKNLPNDKWKFFYEYARKALDEDISRFQKIDDKAAKFLTLVSVVFGVLSAITPWVFENKFPPSNLVEWLLLIVLILAFVSLISSWSLLFRTIKLYRAPRMPLNDQIDTMFWDNDFPNIYYKLTKACRMALDKNREIVEEKGKLINKAYSDITLSAWLVAISVFFIIFVKLNGTSKMPEDQEKQQQQTQQSTQPDRDAQAPDIELVFNSFDPPKKENLNIITEKKDK